LVVAAVGALFAGVSVGLGKQATVEAYFLLVGCGKHFQNLLVFGGEYTQARWGRVVFEHTEITVAFQVQALHFAKLPDFLVAQLGV
jgi:hypothetical protein